MNILDELPVATLQWLATVVLCIIAYLNGDLSVEAAFLALGAGTVGAGVVGHARNGAGRGIRK